MIGWVKTHRQITEWEWYTDANAYRVFTHLIYKVNIERKTWRGVVIERGQIVSSYEKIGLELQLSRQQIRTAINKLLSTNDITTDSHSQHTVFTVKNFNLYQNIPAEQPSDNQPNNQPNNHEITTTKEVKKFKNIKPLSNSEELDL